MGKTLYLYWVTESERSDFLFLYLELILNTFFVHVLCDFTDVFGVLYKK